MACREDAAGSEPASSHRFPGETAEKKARNGKLIRHYVTTKKKKGREREKLSYLSGCTTTLEFGGYKSPVEILFRSPGDFCERDRDPLAQFRARIRAFAKCSLIDIRATCSARFSIRHGIPDRFFRSIATPEIIEA